jgi:hypothetical protein
MDEFEVSASEYPSLDSASLAFILVRFFRTFKIFGADFLRAGDVILRPA